MDYPQRFQNLNEFQTKNLNVVIDIDGVGKFSSAIPKTLVRYGDPNVRYGSGYVYGGLRPLMESEGYYPYLMLDGSSLTISQKIEPEQGRSSISVLSFSFIDKNGFMTQVISPGIVVPEILGRQVKVYLGFLESSFPNDYFIMFRGVITDVYSQSGMVFMQFSDPNIKRKQKVFFTAKTKTTTSLDAVVTTVPVISNVDFHNQILGPDGLYDSAVRTFIQIDNELIEYTPAGFGTNVFTSVTRGANGTTAAAHSSGADVTAVLQLQDHAIDMALKLMLSRGTDYLTNISIAALSGNQIYVNQDASVDLGLYAGDYITVYNSLNPSNNKTCRVISFSDYNNNPNRIIEVDTTFISEIAPVPTVISCRSQFDTYPLTASAKLAGYEVDVARHVYIKNTFLSSAENRLRFVLTEELPLKDFMEAEIYLPISAYSLTRFGQLSMGYTIAPIADQRVQQLDHTNIIDPQSIQPRRAVNNRKMFNEVWWQWDKVSSDVYASSVRYIDSDSLSLIGISSVLPIKSDGIKTDLGSGTMLDRRSQRLLNRYKRGAVELKFKVNFGVGCMIEAGDVVLLVDNGNLHIANFTNGTRDAGAVLYEVTERTLDIKSGQISLTLLAGVQGGISDRYATIAPSSLCGSGTTSTALRINDSFGAIYPQNEWKKWIKLVGCDLTIHSYDWTYSANCTLTGISDDGLFLLVSGLGSAPAVGSIIDLALYDETNSTNNQVAKLLFSYLDKTLTVTGSIDTMHFTVSSADAARAVVGQVVLVHAPDYSRTSKEVKVLSISGTTIEIEETWGFTPQVGDLVDLVGFKDNTSGYRWL